MSRHDVVIVKDTHRGLLYEDGVFREVLPAGRHLIPGQPSRLASILGLRSVRAEVVLVDIRSRDRTVAVRDFLTAEGISITATFAIQFRVSDPLAAVHEVGDFEGRAIAETQAEAGRLLRGMSLDEILGARDEIGEELLRLVRESAAAYGLEVSMLDFKDLVIPEEVREIRNRAVLAGRLRQAQPVGAFAGGGYGESDHAYDPDHDDADFHHAQATFDHDPNVPVDPEPFLLRRPEVYGPSTPRRSVTGFDPALRRFRRYDRAATPPIRDILGNMAR